MAKSAKPGTEEKFATILGGLSQMGSLFDPRLKDQAQAGYDANQAVLMKKEMDRQADEAEKAKKGGILGSIGSKLGGIGGAALGNVLLPGVGGVIGGALGGGLGGAAGGAAGGGQMALQQALSGGISGGIGAGVGNMLGGGGFFGKSVAPVEKVMDSSGLPLIEEGILSQAKPTLMGGLKRYTMPNMMDPTTLMFLQAMQGGGR